MRHQIMVSDETLTRLKSLAEPFVDREPEDVIRRILDQLDQKRHSVKNSPSNADRSTSSRVPRERGARIKIGEKQIDAVSVRDLYRQALQFIVENHKLTLQAILPLKTSSERYLIARKPIHPGGNPFVVPIEFQDIYMEAHKDYKNAIGHLRILIERLGLSLVYLG